MSLYAQYAQNDSINYYLGIKANETGECEKAINYFSQVIHGKDSNLIIISYALRGGSFNLCHKYKEALSDFNYFINNLENFKNIPNYLKATAFFGRGLCTSNMFLIGKEKSIKQDDYPKIINSLNDYDKAINLYIQTNDSNEVSKIFSLKGHLFLLFKENKQALSELLKSIEYSLKQDSLTNFYLARTYYNVGCDSLNLFSKKSSLYYFSKSLEYDSTSYDAVSSYRNRGNCYYESENILESTNDYSKAINLCEGNKYCELDILMSLYLWRGENYALMKMNKKAEEDFNEYLKIGGKYEENADSIRNKIKILGGSPKN